jgi:hypothetical protein
MTSVMPRYGYLPNTHFGSSFRILYPENNKTHHCICSISKVSEKIASYHVILEPVNADQLYNSGGVVTEGGAIPSERTVSGGFLGVGGKGEVLIIPYILDFVIAFI